MNGELALFIVVVAVVAIVGVGIGMLLARPIGQPIRFIDTLPGERAR